MKINGEIGQEILLSGNIKKIMINEDGRAEYCVNVSGSDFSFWLNGADIVFKSMREVLTEELTAEELCGINATDCDNTATNRDSSETDEEYNDSIIPDSASGLPVDDEWSRPAPKKRGRPRKATVEDLINKAKGVQE